MRDDFCDWYIDVERNISRDDKLKLTTRSILVYVLDNTPVHPIIPSLQKKYSNLFLTLGITLVVITPNSSPEQMDEQAAEEMEL